MKLLVALLSISLASCGAILPYGGYMLPNGGIAASQQCDNQWIYYTQTNFCYYAGDHLDFDAAEANCVSLGGHLASIHNAFENTFVQSLTETGQKQGPEGMTWIGMHFEGNNWKWTDGTDNAFQYWMKDDPKKVNKEDCVELLQDEYSKSKNAKGQWNNIECNYQMRKYVCKKAPNM